MFSWVRQPMNRGDGREDDECQGGLYEVGERTSGEDRAACHRQ